jgi:dipeptidyl aminopeptidase/acylaminoacyl peptidase
MTARPGLAALACAAALAVPLGAGATPFSLAAMGRLVSLSDAALSPDAARVAFVASQASFDDNRYRDRLWLYDLPARRLRLLDGAHESYAAPAWSPDGRRLAFVAGDKATRTDQLFVANVSNGAVRRLTAGATGVEDFAWRPDGKAIAFVRRDAAPPKTGRAAFEDAFEVTDNAYLATQVAQPSQLWLADTGTARERRLTSGTSSVADDTISWSAGGRELAYLRAPSGASGIQDRASVAILDLTTLNSRMPAGDAGLQRQPLFSSNGSTLLFLRSRDGDAANATVAALAGAAGANVRDVTRALDRHVVTAAWMPHDRAVLLKVYEGTAGPLYLQQIDGAASRLPLGKVVDARIDPVQSVARDGTIAFVGTQTDRPDELYVLRPGAREPQRLTNFNGPIAALQLGRIATIRWTLDGFSESGVLTYPPGYVAGRRYPLVLRIHGGPTETSEAAFEPFYQLAASHGYLVFAPNYRGSSNAGNAFERAIFNDASEGPGRDVMAGIEAVERLGIVDASRIGVSGWSYGGQLTSWMIGHYHIWKCAVTGAAVNDLVVDYTIADDLDADRAAFSDSPFTNDAMAAWQRQSPIAYYKDIRTPLLLLGNVFDVRVPIVEQYEMYRALRDNHVPVRFFAYPSGGHLPRGPVRLADAYARWLGWFDRYLRPLRS